MRFLSVQLVPGFLLLGSALALCTSSAQTPAQTAVESPSDHCARLAKFTLPNATITSATAVAAGAFDGPRQAFTGADMSALYKMLPAFCRVVMKATPTADSNIGIEVWLPLSGWNGKLQGLGNGGFAGIIDDVALAASVAQGYASTATDAGHTGSPIDATWAMGHPEKVTDFGHRGIHEMTRVAKTIVQQFYGDAPKRSYFTGCSDGGREALMEAQRYPDDYDGILAGAPANNWTGLLSNAVVDLQALTATADSFIPPAKIPVISSAVLAACDKLDGVEDGILNDPRQCHFDPASIECKAGDDPAKCLTEPQVSALKTIYTGIKDSAGRTIFPGYLPGAEDGTGGWGLWITGPAPAKSAQALFGIGYYTNMVYEKADWSYKTFSLDSGIQAAKEKTATALDAVNPDLTAFRAHGGKLILYHGWNDPAISAMNTINYYGDVIAKLGRDNADSFTRLYMVPGLQHCGGGPGTGSFGAFTNWPAKDAQHNLHVALEDWVEKGTAPSTIIASKTVDDKPLGAVTMTRPLCPYPQAARYKGSGDTKSADNFMCAGPDK
ncbi:tannase/feruloyl esterase family alpha/beta hydrolase [Telmatobacter sp. DSM 110680]|uniref:Tannase/feruloyl esterase family alpha/beta hydrolase n=1 Tax=Telmatobacter sp. DSM 110680 TaxID=3036704 RepID=A0AAU7DHZ4_9BACT